MAYMDSPLAFLAFFIWFGSSFIVAVIGARFKLGWILAFLISITFSPFIGLLLVLISGKPNNNPRRWKASVKAAKRAESKGQLHMAKDNYMDAINYLETDYKKLSYIQELLRNDKIAELRTKVEKLNQLISGQSNT